MLEGSQACKWFPDHLADENAKGIPEFWMHLMISICLLKGGLLFGRDSKGMNAIRNISSDHIYIYTAFNREGVDTYIASHIGHLIQRSLKQRSFQRVGTPPVTQERFPRRAPLLQEGRVPRRAPYFLSRSSPEGFLIGPLQCQKREHIGHMQVKKKGHRFIFLLVVRKRACRD